MPPEVAGIDSVMDEEEYSCDLEESFRVPVCGSLLSNPSNPVPGALHDGGSQ